MDNIKDWFKSAHPHDELGDEINPNATFEELKNHLPNAYWYIGVPDSIVREICFEELAKRMGVDYEVVYDQWLYGERTKICGDD